MMTGWVTITIRHADEQQYPLLYQEQPFALRHLSWFYRTPFLKKVEGKGYFVLDAASAA